LFVCALACERERKMGGEEFGNEGGVGWVGGWVAGEEKQGIVEKVEEFDI
jgi:hypothetical protein